MPRYFIHLIGETTWEVAPAEEAFASAEAACAYGREVAQELALHRTPGELRGRQVLRVVDEDGFEVTALEVAEASASSQEN